MGATEGTGINRIPDEIDSREGQLNPYSWYREMRENNSVRYDEVRQCWDVFRYDDVQKVLSDYEMFSSQGTFEAGGGDDQIIDLSETMINKDPPEHERLRGVADEFFEPGYLRDFSGTFAELANQQLDRVLADGNEFDFAAEFAAPIPAYVIGEILGIPPEKRELLLGVRPGAEGTQGELKEYITELVAERKENPGDDVLSQIIHATPDGREMTPEEIYNFCSLLLLAGSHTTITLLTNSIWMFVENDLVSDIQSGDIDLDTAIEEVLRYQPSVHSLIRTAAEDTELRGKSIKEGESVILWLGSANRDPNRFDNPETFDPNRKPNPHMAFGRGIHTCLGAPLARLEARTVLPIFFDRISDIRFTTDDRVPITESTLYGLETLPISVST